MVRLTDDLYRAGTEGIRVFSTGHGESAQSAPWTEVHDQAKRWAGSFRDMGVGPGDVVAVLVEDPAVVAPLVQGVWMRRAAVTMLQQPTARTDLAVWSADMGAACRVAGARTVVVDHSYENIRELAGFTGIAIASAESLRDGETIEPLVGGESDPALLQLTSGSTGVPKAVEVTHRSLYANIRAMAAISPKASATSWRPGGWRGQYRPVRRDSRS